MTIPRIGATSTRALAVAGALALIAAVALTPGALRSKAEAQSPISSEWLTLPNAHHNFTDDIAAQFRLKPDGRRRQVVNLRDASNLAVLRITVQPGARFPWHTHHGPVTVAVTQGELVYVYSDDCVHRPYGAGEAFADPGETVHTAFNPTAEETVVIATFYRAPETGPLTLPVPAAQEAALTAKCGLGAPSAH